jgi:hypothetical protein
MGVAPGSLPLVCIGSSIDVLHLAVRSKSRATDEVMRNAKGNWSGLGGRDEAKIRSNPGRRWAVRTPVRTKAWQSGGQPVLTAAPRIADASIWAPKSATEANKAPPAGGNGELLGWQRGIANCETCGRINRAFAAPRRTILAMLVKDSR